MVSLSKTLRVVTSATVLVMGHGCDVVKGIRVLERGDAGAHDASGSRENLFRKHQSRDAMIRAHNSEISTNENSMDRGLEEFRNGSNSTLTKIINRESFLENENSKSPVIGMKCKDGTVLDGSTGPERTITREMLCKMFPKHPWQYPILGYKSQHKGTQFPYDCERQLGGYVYSNGVRVCPQLTPEQIHDRCMTSDVPYEIIRDMACVVRRDVPKLGRFLNNKNNVRNLFEFASFMAHLGQETADFRTMWESDGNAGQYCSYFYPGDDKYCQQGKLFYGRGVHQLTHPSNYADFSAYWFKDKTVLLSAPEKILDDMEISWGSAIWFWMEKRQHHNGDANCARWTLMHDALFDELGFGQTISAINGGLECSGSNQIGPWQRLGRLIFFLDVFKVPMPFFESNSTKAIPIPKWFTEGCSYIDTYKLSVRRTTWKALESLGNDCKGFNQPYLCGWGGLQQGPSSVPRPLVAFNTGGGGAVSGPTCVKHKDPQGGRNVWPHTLTVDQGYHKIGDTSDPPTEPEEPKPEPEEPKPEPEEPKPEPEEPKPEPEEPKPEPEKPKPEPEEPKPEPEKPKPEPEKPKPEPEKPKPEPEKPKPEPEKPKPEPENPKPEPEPPTPNPGPGGSCACRVSDLKNFSHYTCNPAGAKTFCDAPWDQDGDPECCSKDDFEAFANTQGCTCK